MEKTQEANIAIEPQTVTKNEEVKCGVSLYRYLINPPFVMPFRRKELIA